MSPYGVSELVTSWGWSFCSHEVQRKLLAVVTSKIRNYFWKFSLIFFTLKVTVWGKSQVLMLVFLLGELQRKAITNLFFHNCKILSLILFCFQQHDHWNDWLWISYGISLQLYTWVKIIMSLETDLNQLIQNIFNYGSYMLQSAQNTCI